MAPDRLSHETDSAVEQLLLKRNGQKKTVQDVFEVVVAMHHDRTKDMLLLLNELKANTERMERHLSDDVRMSNDEFRDMIDGFNQKHVDRDALVAELDRELEVIKENCTKLHERAPRRKTDPETEDWGNSYGGEQARQVWFMWLLGTAVGKVLIFVAGGVAMLLIDKLIGGGS